MHDALRDSWAISLRHLAASRFYLPEKLFFEEAIEFEGQLIELLHHNELGLALDAAEMLGTICNAPKEFWEELKMAAENMGLKDETARYNVLAST